MALIQIKIVLGRAERVVRERPLSCIGDHLLETLVLVFLVGGVFHGKEFFDILVDTPFI